MLRQGFPWALVVIFHFFHIFIFFSDGEKNVYNQFSSHHHRRERKMIRRWGKKKKKFFQ